MVVSEQPRVDFYEVDQILDIIEPFMLSLAGEHRLIGAHTERWRWDVPDIVLVWVDRDRDNVSKNIHAWVKGNSPQYKLAVDANAWLDDGASRTRLWSHESYGAIDVNAQWHPEHWSGDVRWLLVQCGANEPAV